MNGEPVEILIERVCAFKRKPPIDGHKQLGCSRCGLPKGHVDHMGAPPSLNLLGSGNPMVYQSFKQRWGAVFAEQLQRAGLPRGLARVAVEGECCFPDSNARDQGNYRFILEKALGDTLVTGGWLADDTWQRYEFSGLAYRYERGRSYTRLLIFPTDTASERLAA